MNFCPPSRQRLFLGLAPLFLFIGLAAMAQQAADDKSRTEIPPAGVNGVGMPRCEYCPDPEYSKEAKKKKVQGIVVLFVVVTIEGKATDISVAKSSGLGLDEMAIEAVRKWRFKPAMKDGKPVAVKVPVEMTFRLSN
jgi:TonB family protein